MHPALGNYKYRIRTRYWQILNIKWLIRSQKTWSVHPYTHAHLFWQYIYPFAVKYHVVCVYSGRTEYQATHSGKVRRASTFERRPSKRYPSRAQSMAKGRSVVCVPYAVSPFNNQPNAFLICLISVSTLHLP